MLLDRAGTVGGEQARKVFDALQKRFADVRICDAFTGVRRIDGLLRGMMATRDHTRDGSSVMKRSGPSVISNAA